MTDASPAKSFLDSNITSTPEEMDILSGDTLNEERKLELTAKLKKFRCLWENSSPETRNCTPRNLGELERDDLWLSLSELKERYSSGLVCLFDEETCHGFTADRWLSWLNIGLYAESREFDSGPTNTLGLKITEWKVLPM